MRNNGNGKCENEIEEDRGEDAQVREREMKDKLLFPLLLAKGYFSDPMTRIDITELTQLVKSKTKLNESRYLKFISVCIYGRLVNYHN